MADIDVDIASHPAQALVGQMKKIVEDVFTPVDIMEELHTVLSEMGVKVFEFGKKMNFGNSDEQVEQIIADHMKLTKARNVNEQIKIYLENTETEEEWEDLREAMQERITELGGPTLRSRASYDKNGRVLKSISSAADFSSETLDDHLGIPNADTIIRLNVGFVSSSVEGIPFGIASQEKTRITISFSHYVTIQRQLKYKVTFQWCDHTDDSSTVTSVTYDNIDTASEIKFRQMITHLKNMRKDDFEFISFDAGKVSLKSQFSQFSIIEFNPKRRPTIRSGVV
jgi:hypothetical protein